ncbi:MAG: class I SAM-dependent methyltransferase [bacterium]
MNENSTFDKIANFYNKRVQAFGHDPLACDYGRAASQQRKFAVLASVTDYAGLSVLDVGCGFADYAGFLSDRHRDVEYHGIDLSPAMIEMARQARPDLDLRVANILDLPEDVSYDVVSANGIFYLLGTEAPFLMRRLVGEMFRRSRRGVVFNSLSTWASIQEDGEFYADPLEVVAWCRELSPWVVLRHDYLPHDFTVFVARQSWLT